jgi:hypothetical protein
MTKITITVACPDCNEVRHVVPRWGKRKITGPSPCRKCSGRRVGLTNQRFTTYRGQVVPYRKHPLYSVLANMRDRCENPGCASYPKYGAKGISVFEGWRTDFETFVAWAEANGWQPGLTIDRIDSSRGYHPDNCEWVTRQENSRRSWVTTPVRPRSTG